MRNLLAALIGVSCAIGCSSTSGSSSHGSDLGGDDADAAGSDAPDVEVCSPLGDFTSEQAVCPSTRNGVNCTAYAYVSGFLSCSTLDAFVVGIGIDTVTRCYYDRTSQALVGATRSGPFPNGYVMCWGRYDASCVDPPDGKPQCSPDAGAGIDAESD